MVEFFESVENYKDQKDHSLWCERYRPIALEDYIGNESLIVKVRRYILENDIPHLLFYGKAGTGKTTLAKLIVKNINCDYLYINASDERGIDIIRNRIKTFASSVGFSPLKIIILDEADYLTPDAQAALRNLMETFSKHTRFILTCNYHEKIIDPIISRLQLFEIIPPSKKEVAIQIMNILKAEQIKFANEDIVIIVNKFYPDIRKIINNAQLMSIDGIIKLDNETLIETNVKNKLIDILDGIKDNRDKFRDIRQLIADSKITMFDELYRHLFDNVDKYASKKIANVIIILADSQSKDVFAVDKEINFMSCVIQIISEI